MANRNPDGPVRNGDGFEKSSRSRQQDNQAVTEDWQRLYFPHLNNVASPNVSSISDGPLGNSRLATRQELLSLLSSADARPDDYVRLLDAYAIAHDPDVNVVPAARLPIPLGQDSPNLMVFGRSGSGKTEKVIMPAIIHAFSNGWAAMIINIKGRRQTNVIRELAHLFCPGLKVQVVAPRDENRTLCWTGLDGCRDIWEAGEVAECMVAAAAPRDRKHWCGNQAKEWIQHAIAAICRNSPSGRATLVELRKVALSGGYEAFANLHPAFPALNSFSQYAVTHNQNGMTVASTIKEATSFIDGVETFLSTNELDLHDFAVNGGCLVVEIDEHNIEQLSPLITLFLRRLISELQQVACKSSSGRLPHKTGLFVDEWSVAGPIPGIVKCLHTCRERGYGFVAGSQSITQFQAVFGDEAKAVINGFQSQIALAGGLDLETAEHFSRKSGVSTIAIPTSLEKSEDVTERFVPSSTWTMTSRPALLPSDVSSPKSHPLLGMPATIMMGDGVTPTFQAYLRHSFEIGQVAKIIQDVCNGVDDDTLRRTKALSKPDRKEKAEEKRSVKSSSQSVDQESVLSVLGEMPQKMKKGFIISQSAKTGLAIVLVKCGGQKLEAIFAIRALTGLSARECKLLIENAPIIIGRCSSREHADYAWWLLSAARITVEIQ